MSQRGLPVVLIGAGLPQVAKLAGETKSYAERLFDWKRIGPLSFISEIAEDKIVLISTHVVSDIEFIAKEIILLKSGQLVSHDTCTNLTKEIENKVFEVEINKEELKYFQDNYRVSNLYHNDEKIIVRLVTDIPPENYEIQSVKATLEDLYLYVFENGK